MANIHDVQKQEVHRFDATGCCGVATSATHRFTPRMNVLYCNTQNVRSHIFRVAIRRRRIPHLPGIASSIASNHSTLSDNYKRTAFQILSEDQNHWTKIQWYEAQKRHNDATNAAFGRSQAKSSRTSMLLQALVMHIPHKRISPLL